MAPEQPSIARPARWEIEHKLIEIVCRCFEFSPSKVEPDSRLLEDLHLDSLCLAEFMMEVEETFSVTIKDEDYQSLFPNQPATIRTISALVLNAWGTGKSSRPGWKQTCATKTVGECMPSLQLGGRLEKAAPKPSHEPLGSNREGFAEFRRGTDGMRCIRIPGGEVRLGSSDPEVLPDQRPEHTVQVSSFLIDAEPVSNAAYARFLNSVAIENERLLSEWFGADPEDDGRKAHVQIHRVKDEWRPVPGTEHHPVVLVSWYGANAYSLWANQMDWRWYRGDGTFRDDLPKHGLFNASPNPAIMYSCLPSEAQWEYVARGADARKFPWGSQPASPQLACAARHAIGRLYKAATLPTALVSQRLGVSPFGALHMAGNVWQWCRDWYSPDFYSTQDSRQQDPQNIKPSGIRSERGGSWVGPYDLVRSSYRRGRPPKVKGRCLGFRCTGVLQSLSSQKKEGLPQ